MPDKSRQKKLLIGAATAGSLAAGAAAVEGKLAEKARKTAAVESGPVAKQRARLARRQSDDQRVSQRQRIVDEEAAKHPGKRMADKAYREDPKAFRKQVKAGRLARRAAKAAGRMGAVGTVASLPGMLESATRIEKEGGAWSARFAKFVEEALGVPAGTTGRSLTDAERLQRESY